MKLIAPDILRCSYQNVMNKYRSEKAIEANRFGHNKVNSLKKITSEQNRTYPRMSVDIKYYKYFSFFRDFLERHLRIKERATVD